jgi:hypothetical protein
MRIFASTERPDIVLSQVSAAASAPTVMDGCEALFAGFLAPSPSFYIYWPHFQYMTSYG